VSLGDSGSCISDVYVVMMCFCISDADEPKKQSLKGLLNDPATSINAGNFCMLFVFFCFGKLLPLAEVVDEPSK
jgi:hypothetical protein